MPPETPYSASASTTMRTALSSSLRVDTTCSDPERRETRQLIRRSRSPAWNGRIPENSAAVADALRPVRADQPQRLRRPRPASRTARSPAARSARCRTRRTGPQRKPPQALVRRDLLVRRARAVPSAADSTSTAAAAVPSRSRVPCSPPGGCSATYGVRPVPRTTCSAPSASVERAAAHVVPCPSCRVVWSTVDLIRGAEVGRLTTPSTEQSRQRRDQHAPSPAGRPGGPSPRASGRDGGGPPQRRRSAPTSFMPGPGPRCPARGCRGWAPGPAPRPRSTPPDTSAIHSSGFTVIRWARTARGDRLDVLGHDVVASVQRAPGPRASAPAPSDPRGDAPVSDVRVLAGRGRQARRSTGPTLSSTSTVSTASWMREQPGGVGDRVEHDLLLPTGQPAAEHVVLLVGGRVAEARPAAGTGRAAPRAAGRCLRTRSGWRSRARGTGASGRRSRPRR